MHTHHTISFPVMYPHCNTAITFAPTEEDEDTSDLPLEVQLAREKEKAKRANDTVQILVQQITQVCPSVYVLLCECQPSIICASRNSVILSVCTVQNGAGGREADVRTASERGESEQTGSRATD